MGASVFVVPLIKQVLFLLLLGLFNLMRELCGLLSGRNIRRPSGSAEVLKVRCRYNLDIYLRPSSKTNFLMTHEKYVEPEYVLRDECSMYSVSANEAVFIESEPHIDVTSSHVGSFLRAAQFKFAKRVITMPIAEFHRLAEKIGDPKGTIVFVSNTGRCGSTLLTQLVEESEKAMSFSEPDCLQGLNNFKYLPDDIYDRLNKNAIRMMCKPSTRLPDPLMYCFKITVPAMEHVPSLTRVFPSCKNLFMYRDLMPTCKSFDRVGNELPLVEMAFVLGSYSSFFTSLALKAMNLPAEGTTTKVLSRTYFAIKIVSNVIRQYREFRKEGMDIVGVRFEDIVEDPTDALTQIYKHCNMPLELVERSVRVGMSRDSQANSRIGRHNLSKYKPEEFTPERKAHCQPLLQEYNLPEMDQPLLLEGTITHKHADAKFI